MHKLLPLRDHAQNFKVELGPSKPQDRIARPEVGKLAALESRLLDHRGPGSDLLRVDQINQKGIVLIKVNAAYSGSPIVATRIGSRVRG